MRQIPSKKRASIFVYVYASFLYKCIFCTSRDREVCLLIVLLSWWIVVRVSRCIGSVVAFPCWNVMVINVTSWFDVLN